MIRWTVYIFISNPKYNTLHCESYVNRGFSLQGVGVTTGRVWYQLSNPVMFTWKQLRLSKSHTIFTSMMFNQKLHPKQKRKTTYKYKLQEHFSKNKLALCPFATIYFSNAFTFLQYTYKVDIKALTPRKLTPKLQKFTRALLIMLVTFWMPEATIKYVFPSERLASLLLILYLLSSLDHLERAIIQPPGASVQKTTKTNLLT